MIKCEIWADDRATLIGPFPFPMLKLINNLSGRKFWDGANVVKIVGTPANIRMLRETDYQIEFIDLIGQLNEQEKLQAMPTQHAKPEELEIEYFPGLPFYDHQDRCVKLSWFREFYALLFEVGLGKTAILIATAGILYLLGRLTGVLILAPKGVHRQWIEEEIPKHLDKRIEWYGVLWKKKIIKDFHTRAKRLTFFAMNTDAIRTKDGLKAAKAFMMAHKGKVMLIADESHDFKTQSSARTEALFELGAMATFRRIATGTPWAKNIVDMWAQFNFLSEKILGYKYLTAFRVRFCTLARDGRTIVAQKNTEEFYSLIAPHSFRLTQDEALDLPEKIYVTREYEMSDETEKHYSEMKKTLLTKMSDGTIVDGVNAAVAMLRLHQIVCGHLPDPEDKSIVHRFGGERVKTLIDIVKQREGPIVIWARFIEDRKLIIEALKAAVETFAVYEGTEDERKKAKDDWLSGRVRNLVLNQRSGGVGLNLQGKCRTAIYFSNSFNAVDRWQSEGRIYRIGTEGSVTNFDIVARKSVDRTILKNLQSKRDLASLTLDEIRQAIISEE